MHSHSLFSALAFRVGLVSTLVLGTACARILSDIDGQEGVALVSSGAMLVDVRSAEEYAEGHVEGAVNIPHTEIVARSDELGAKNDPIVVYCASGVRSWRAKKALTEAGFTAVMNLGSIKSWPAPPP